MAMKAPVHQSLLIVQLFAGVPYTAAWANIAQTCVMVMTLQWYRWILLGTIFHGLLAVVTGDDPHRIHKLWRYCSYAAFYRAG